MTGVYYWVCAHGVAGIGCSCIGDAVTATTTKLTESESERTELLRERAELLDALTRLVYELPAGERGNAPGHAHKLPGIWDDDNRDRAGERCRLCDAYARAVRFVGRPGEEDER